jgi:malate synthase
MVIEYLEGWLNGRGAKGIDSLEGQPGIHPALMEDLATGRMSVAQIAQRIIHAVKDSESGEIHDFDTVKNILKEQLNDILKIREESGVLDSHMKQRYQDAYIISLRWIKNYTEYNFRSLGTYSHKDLLEIASSPQAF